MVCGQFWGRKWLRQFYGRLEKVRSFCSSIPIRSLVLRGGVFWVLGGWPILFFGREDFSERKNSFEAGNRSKLRNLLVIFHCTLKSYVLALRCLVSVSTRFLASAMALAEKLRDFNALPRSSSFWALFCPTICTKSSGPFLVKFSQYFRPSLGNLSQFQRQFKTMLVNFNQV